LPSDGKNSFGSRLPKGAGSFLDFLLNFRMATIPQNRAKLSELVPVLDGPSGRGRPLRVLFAHSCIEAVKRCVQELGSSNFKVSTDIAANSAQFAKRLGSKFYDLILFQHPIADWEGIQPLALLRRMKRHVPLIFVGDEITMEAAAGLITEGAADCIQMDHVGHLPVAVRRALSEGNVREERDRAQEKLRHSEAHYRALVGNLSYGICRCSLEGQFLDVNRALLAMLGYASKEELGTVSLVTDIFRDPGRRAQMLGHSIEQKQEGQVDPLEVEWKRKDGAPLKIRLSGREVSNEAGGMDGYEVIVEDVTKQRELEDQLRRQAAKDPLTGLANYRHLVDILDTEIRRSRRTRREFALLLLDMDGLKQINDRYGHVTGSQALCRLADILSMGCRGIDTAARFGGDEFAVVLPETGVESANLVAHRIRNKVANDGGKPSLSVSVGVALYPVDGDKLDVLLGAADAALYVMKARAHGAVARP
jgi:diguanylate cyclase (GGDEF)-like protein/PAS domain S-box-containing protein